MDKRTLTPFLRIYPYRSVARVMNIKQLSIKSESIQNSLLAGGTANATIPSNYNNQGVVGSDRNITRRPRLSGLVHQFLFHNKDTDILTEQRCLGKESRCTKTHDSL